ncbi:MAG: hypothetical protein HY438_00380 [DPANN group archaeon]|nr:hypothetical protein [DPANN group archaeon]
MVSLSSIKAKLGIFPKTADAVDALDDGTIRRFFQNSVHINKMLAGLRETTMRLAMEKKRIERQKRELERKLASLRQSEPQSPFISSYEKKIVAADEALLKLDRDITSELDGYRYYLDKLRSIANITGGKILSDRKITAQERERYVKILKASIN